MIASRWQSNGLVKRRRTATWLVTARNNSPESKDVALHS